MKRIYLDSNVLIAHYSLDRAEEAKKGMVENALAVFAELKDIQLCTSMWAVTEMVNILVSSKKMDHALVALIEGRLVNERRLQHFWKPETYATFLGPVVQSPSLSGCRFEPK